MEKKTMSFLWLGARNGLLWEEHHLAKIGKTGYTNHTAM
jgi:hypothetical protein